MKLLKNSKFCTLGKAVCFLAMLTIGACGVKKDNPKAGEMDLGDIVNGKTVTKKNESSHSIVAIIAEKNEGQALCTGTIVSPEVILTAAHCVEEAPLKMHIVFGLNVQKAKGKDIREADKFIQHPNWNRHLPGGEGDLALIHFKGALPEGFAVVKLASENLKLKIGQKILMAGFGVTNGQSETGSGKLRETNSSIIDQHSVNEFVTDGQKSGVCFGDSGGPAFIKSENELIQWGVASSVTNKSCNEASIHTGVMKYVSWIKSSINKMQH